LESTEHKEGDKMANNNTDSVRNVIILGSGPAGLTAALYTGRANLNPLVLHGNQPGGQLTTTTEIENFPGFKEGVDGNEMIDNMTKQAERFGTDFKFGYVTEVDFTKQPIRLITSDKQEYLTKTLIISTGARPRKLGIPSEEKYWSKGVTSCATCDGYFYKGQDVCVIGGGDSAMEEALFLTRMCTKVYIIHRRDKFRASKIMADRALENPKIEPVWDSYVDEIVGDTKVTGVNVKNVNTGEVRHIPLKGVFLGIGHIPNTEPFVGKLDMDANGYLLTGAHSTTTNVPGVFACGDVQDRRYKQAVTAAGTVELATEATVPAVILLT